MRNPWQLTWMAAGLLAVCAAPGCGDGDGAMADAATADAATNDAAINDAGDHTTYAARAIIGALDRLRISQADDSADVCTVLRLVHPGFQGEFDLTVPEGWSVEMAHLSSGAANCHDIFEIPSNPLPALSGTGEVTWMDNGEFYPTRLSIDATITFDTGDLPATAILTAVDIPVAL